MHATQALSPPASSPHPRDRGELSAPGASERERRVVHGDRRELASRLASDVVERVLASGLTRDRAIAEVAAQQYGVIARAQLAALGLGAGAIDHRLRSGRLHRLHRGVYAVGHAVLVPLAAEMAAVLACGPDTVLSHQSAAALWRLRPHDPGEVHVTVLRSGAVTPRPACASDAFPRCPGCARRGIPVTSAPRTIIDLADALSERDLARAIAEAEIRDLARRSDLLAAVDRAANGRRGCARLARILGGGGGPTLTRSEAEERLLALIADAKLPMPEVNVRVRGHEVDMLWRARRLVVEVDGYAFHSTRVAFERDRARDADLHAGGLGVLRVSWRQIVDEPYALIVRVAQALVSRAEC